MQIPTRVSRKPRITVLIMALGLKLSVVVLFDGAQRHFAIDISLIHRMTANTALGIQN